MRLNRGYNRAGRTVERRTAARVMRGGSAMAGGREARRAERRSARQALQADPRLRSRAEDFVRRYTTGDPRQGYDEDEAAEMFELVRANSTPEELQEALQATVRNLPPDQQEQVARMLQAQEDGSSGQSQRMGIGGGGGLGDLLGGLLGGGMGGGMMGGPMRGGMGSASASPFGALLGGLIGTAGQPMPMPYQRSGDPISSLLGGLLGGGSGPLARHPMMGGMMGGSMGGSMGGGLGGMLGGLLGGGSSGMMGGYGYGQSGYGRQAGSDPMGGLMKVIMGGMAAYAMQKMLSGR